MKPQRDRLVDRPTARAATCTPEARGLARDQVRLLVSGRNGHQHAIFRELADFLPMGTLLVVNTSATLPASLHRQRPLRVFHAQPVDPLRRSTVAGGAALERGQARSTSVRGQRDF